jgi:hypothetical protein
MLSSRVCLWHQHDRKAPRYADPGIEDDVIAIFCMCFWVGAADHSTDRSRFAVKCCKSSCKTTSDPPTPNLISTTTSNGDKFYRPLRNPKWRRSFRNSCSQDLAGSLQDSCKRSIASTSKFVRSMGHHKIINFHSPSDPLPGRYTHKYYSGNLSSCLSLLDNDVSWRRFSSASKPCHFSLPPRTSAAPLDDQ